MLKCTTYIVDNGSFKFLLLDYVVKKNIGYDEIELLYFPLALNYDFLVYGLNKKCVDENILKGFRDYEHLVRIVNEHIVKPLRRPVYVKVFGRTIYLKNYDLESLPVETLGVLLWIDNGKSIDDLIWITRRIGLMANALRYAGFLKITGNGLKMTVDREKVTRLIRRKLAEKIWEMKSVLPLIYMYNRDKYVDAVERSGKVRIPRVKELKKYYIYTVIAKEFAPELLYEASAIYGVLVGKIFAEYSENLSEKLMDIQSDYLRGYIGRLKDACMGRDGFFIMKYLEYKGVCSQYDKVLEVKING